jgi:glycogen operon protein
LFAIVNVEIGVKDVIWLCPTGAEMTQGHWDDANARCFGILLDGRAQETGIVGRGSDAALLLVCNAHFDVVNFAFPSVAEGRSWDRLLDTNQPDAQRTNSVSTMSTR